MIPHRPPFLLIDRVISADPTTGRLVALRRLSADDALGPAASETGAPFGAAPAEFPRTLLIEALCQAAACLNGLALSEKPVSTGESPENEPEIEIGGSGSAGHRGFLVAISGFRFPDSAHIGETLELSVTRRESLGAVVAFDASATVIENPAAPPRTVAAGRLLFAVTLT